MDTRTSLDASLVINVLKTQEIFLGVRSLSTDMWVSSVIFYDLIPGLTQWQMPLNTYLLQNTKTEEKTKQNCVVFFFQTRRTANGRRKPDWLNWMNPTAVSTRSTSILQSCLHYQKARSILCVTGTTLHSSTHSFLQNWSQYVEVLHNTSVWLVMKSSGQVKIHLFNLV